MKISSLNRYLLQKLVQRKTSLTINTASTTISLSLLEISKNSNLGDNIPSEKVTELESLLTEHRSLSANNHEIINSKELSAIEKQILSILGLKFNVLTYVSLLNKLSKIAGKYLGKKMVASYWMLSKPNEEALELFLVKDSGEIVFQGSQNTILSQELEKKIQLWIEKFINQCSLIIRDFGNIILADNQK